MYCVAKSDAVKIKTAAAILVGSGRRCSDEEYILQRAAKGLLAEAAMPAGAEVVPAQVVLPAADDDGAPPPIALLLSILRERRDESLIAVIVLRGSMVIMFAMRMIG